MKRAILLLTLVIAMACSHDIDRERWVQMSHDEKIVYVRSLLGHEQAKQQKGGNPNGNFWREPSVYVSRIDEAYANGDRRTAEAIFETMGDKRP